MAFIEEAVPETQKLTLIPKPGFVVKTRLEQPTKAPDIERKLHTKVFINVCSNQHVPMPESSYSKGNNDDNDYVFRPEIIYPLIVNNQWEIPIIVSSERTDHDNKNQLSYVYDCFINDRCMTWVTVHKELRQIVAEWCLESVELRFSLSLDREVVKYPKMSYKGQLRELVVLKRDLESVSFQGQKRELEKLAREQDHLMMLNAVQEANDGNEVDRDDGISIFGSGIGGTGRQNDSNSKKPKIQEIETVNVPKKKKATINSEQKNSNNPLTTTTEPNMTNRKIPIKYELQFVNLKDQSQGHRLLINVKSQIETAQDYHLTYDPVKQSLLLKCLNNLYFCKAEYFEIPVPRYLVDSGAKAENDGGDKVVKFKSFFDKENKTLAIFI